MRSYEKYIAACITAVLCIGYITYYMTVVEKGNNYAEIGGAVVIVTEISIFGLIGLLPLSVGRTKSIGQGILLYAIGNSRSHPFLIAEGWIH